MERHNLPEYTSKIEGDNQELLHQLHANVALSIEATGIKNIPDIEPFFSGELTPTFQISEKGIELPDVPEVNNGAYAVHLTKSYVEAQYHMGLQFGQIESSNILGLRLVTNEFINEGDGVIVLSRDYRLGNDMDMTYGFGVTYLDKEGVNSRREVLPGSNGAVMGTNNEAPIAVSRPLNEEVLSEGEQYRTPEEKRHLTQLINTASMSVWSTSCAQEVIPIQEKQQLLGEMNFIIKQMV